jgi:hypothetical protein
MENFNMSISRITKELPAELPALRYKPEQCPFATPEAQLNADFFFSINFFTASYALPNRLMCLASHLTQKGSVVGLETSF